MGKATEGIAGPVSGKVGPHVYYMLNGKPCVRSLPSKRSGKKTKKEKNNTTGFAKVQAFLKPIKSFLKVGFKDYGTSTGGYRGAVSYALRNAVEGEHPDRVVNPALVRVCGGELHFPETYEVVFEPDQVVRFTWSAEVGQNGNPYDQVFMLAYSPADAELNLSSMVGVSTGAFRMTGTDSLTLTPARLAREYHIYMGFIAKDRSGQAHSQYMGKILVPAK
ncbi:hypothetical protein ABIE26_004542 [Pedobacter africanus]|uniref:Uncharacterized protein n=1 Tax=Pedobacter africanus TaxID=151894 RepID=A0ACC6L3X4_9SPHI|nr:DUF6266 family protein [Pedobacter africanus]MDR6785988.1 hypothetical protein [Pedobacter africanus]